ncbi:hypothetical protein BBJ28_00018592 [Nothophytophthora sp. Chile5]|nr:hypothetical protein BBJ28_00018592 [Nothophytophthora sp. Chile5]
MVTHGRKRSVIYDFLFGQGENVIQKDVDNSVQILQAERADPRDDDDACTVVLAKFASVEGNVATVDGTNAGETGVICLSKDHMLSNYQLCTLMGIDENGEGQPVQQSVRERNADWHMSRALEHMMRANPGAADKVHVIMVDMDLNEIRTLQSYFPRARILICVFHMIKYLKFASRKPEYGMISSDDHESIDTLVHKLVYAQSEEVYENDRPALRWTCKSVGSMPFFDYMEKNWHSCMDMWVAYKRAKLPHFRVHTNNHLEFWFGKFKGCVKSAMKLAQTVEELVGEVLMFTNHFVAGRVEQQYAMAASKVNEFDYVVDTADERVTVTGDHKSHAVVLRT